MGKYFPTEQRQYIISMIDENMLANLVNSRAECHIWWMSPNLMFTPTPHQYSLNDDDKLMEIYSYISQI